ncbi:MAG: DEAD/DEAH box helicase [Euryarchaeota archaeon]|nr:DEAD/DEAH box helicase [Euryarchaeota archaeon]
MRFEEARLSPEVLRAVGELKYEQMTEIQELVIPRAMKGEDVIGHSATGSGKTAAFAIPILEKIDRKGGLQALVISPTRELALQITEMTEQLGKYTGVRVATLYGGVSLNPQFDAVRISQIAVGTPGRLLDHLQRRTLDLRNLKILVIDEGDRLLDMGFLPDVGRILRQCPKQRQTLLFSATVPEEVKRIINSFMVNPVYLSSVKKTEEPKIQQFYMEVDRRKKIYAIEHILMKERPPSAIIFCNTQHMVHRLAQQLQRMRFPAAGIHGGLTQAERTRVMDRFKSGDVRVLVATDVAARGLDISGISHIINYDIPNSADDYTHRIGRTARAGKTGKAYSLIDQEDRQNMSVIMQEREELIRVDAGRAAPPRIQGDYT